MGGGAFRTPGSPHLLTRYHRPPEHGARLGAGTGLGKMPRALRSCLLVHPFLHTGLAVLSPRPSRLLCSSSEAPPFAVHTLSLTLASRRLAGCSQPRRERVKPGAVPGRGGAEARGWDPGEGARGLGGRGAHTGDLASRPPPGLAEAGPRGVPHPHPESSAQRSRGARRAEGSARCPPSPPSPCRSRPGPADLGIRWTLPRTPELPQRAASSSRASAGRSPRAHRRSSHLAQLPAFHLGPAARPADRALVGTVPRRRGPRVRARALVPCPPAALLGWRLQPSDADGVQDFPCWTCCHRGTRCTRVLKWGDSPPRPTPS